MKAEMYKGFKKVQEDDKTATFEHEKGHKLTLLKGGLEGSERKKLSKLPLYQADPTEPVQDPTEGLADDSDASDASTGKAVNITINSAPQQPNASIDTTKTNPISPADWMASGRPLKDMASANDEAMAARRAQENPPAQTTAPQIVPTAPPPNPAPASVPNVAPALSPAVPPTPAATAQPALSGQLQDLNTQYQQNVKRQQDADAEFQAAMTKEGGIDPNRIFKNKSGIATTLGLILGGIGSGITGQPNAALQILNKQVDNDIQAQKDDRSNKFNLYKMHLQSLGDENAAILQTQNNLKQAAIVKMDEMMGKLGSNPMAQQRLLAEKTQLQNDIANNQLQLARHHTMQQIYQNLPGQSGQPASIQNSAQLSRVLVSPENGATPAEIEAADKELNGVQQTQAKHQAADALVDRISGLQTVGNRVMNPIQSGQQIAAAKAEFYPLIQNEDPSKRLTPEQMDKELEPLMPGLTSGKTTVEGMRQGVHRLIDTNSPGTATLQKFQVPVPKYDPQVRVVDPNGRPGKIPASQLQKAVSQGFKRAA